MKVRRAGGLCLQLAISMSGVPRGGPTSMFTGPVIFLKAMKNFDVQPMGMEGSG